MSKQAHQAAAAHYKGIRVTLTQHPEAPFSYVGVSTKQTYNQWDDWHLLFPPVRVELERADDYRSVLRSVAVAIEEILALE